MAHRFRISGVEEQERWIFLSHDGDWQEPDAFVALLKRISGDLHSDILPLGDCTYALPGDGLGLRYQWDDLYGVSVVCPQEIAVTDALAFLSRYADA